MIRYVADKCKKEEKDGEPECIFKTCNITKYFKVCCSNDCNDRVYVFLYDGGRIVCVKPYRDRRVIRNKSDGAGYTGRDGHFYNACHRRECGDYEKNGGEKSEEAKEDFTFLILINVLVGFMMCTIGYLVMEPVFACMNLSADVSAYCVGYLSRYLLFTVPILLMNNFTLYMIASEKATLSLVCSVAGGVANMILDYVLIAVFDMGISGAAIATGLGYSVTAVVGLFVFSRKKNLLHFKKPVFRFRVLVNAATNGCSEMATALVTGIITMMFNWTMLRYVGEDGVAAVTIIMYVLMFASSLYTGYSYGVTPMMSFYFGENNREKLKKLVGVSLWVIAFISILTVAASFFDRVPGIRVCPPR